MRSPAAAAVAAAYWVATADDAMSDEGYDAVVGALAAMPDSPFDADALLDALDAWDEALDADEDGFLRDLAEDLGDETRRRGALARARALAAMDGPLSPEEERALATLAGVFGFDARGE